MWRLSAGSTSGSVRDARPVAPDRDAGDERDPKPGGDRLVDQAEVVGAIQADGGAVSLAGLAVIGWPARGFPLGRYSPGVVAPFSLLDLAATVLILAGLACIVLRSTRSQLPLATRAMSPSLQPSAARSPSTS